LRAGTAGSVGASPKIFAFSRQRVETTRESRDARASGAAKKQQTEQQRAANGTAKSSKKYSHETASRPWSRAACGNCAAS
jgi:hypothetical protein